MFARKQRTKLGDFTRTLDEAVGPHTTIGDVKGHASPAENRHGNAHDVYLPFPHMP